MTTWDQPSLFADTAGPVRPTDPDTSAEAAAMPGKATQRQRVLRCLLTYGMLRDETISQLLGIDKGSAAKRRGELVELGLVRWTEQTEKTDRGAPARVWELTPEGRRVAFDG